MQRGKMPRVTRTAAPRWGPDSRPSTPDRSRRSARWRTSTETPPAPTPAKSAWADRSFRPSAIPLPSSIPITPAHRAQRNRLQRELRQDGLLGRADGLAHANLARSFGHAHQHDVHHAHAAHQQRHATRAKTAAGTARTVIWSHSRCSVSVPKMEKLSGLSLQHLAPPPQQLGQLILHRQRGSWRRRTSA